MGAIPTPLALLIDSPLNPRKRYDEAKINDLANSIKEKGLLTHLIGRPAPDSDKVEIVCGHCRFRAAKLAGLEDVPVEIRNLDDRQTLEIMLIENIHRDDLHPIEEAGAYQALRDNHGYDVPSIAARTGKSESYVYRRLSLLNLAPEVQKAYQEEKITAGHAELIGRLPLNQQLRALDHAWQDWKGTPCRVSDLKEWISRTFHRILENAPFSRIDEELLPWPVTSCNKCTKRSGAAPALFDDLGRADICTDAECYDKKVEANFRWQKRTLKQQHGELVQISTRAYGGKQDVLNTEQYVTAKPSDEGAIPALVAEGPEKGRVVHIIPTKQGKQQIKAAAGKKEQTSEGGEDKPAKVSPEKQQEERKALAEVRNLARSLAREELLKVAKLSGEKTLTAFLVWLFSEVSFGFENPNKVKTLRDAALAILEAECKHAFIAPFRGYEDVDFDDKELGMAAIFKVKLEPFLLQAKAQLAKAKEPAAAAEDAAAEASTPTAKKTAVKKAAAKQTAKPAKTTAKTTATKKATKK